MNDQKYSFTEKLKDIFMTQFNAHSLFLGLLIVSFIVVIYLFIPTTYTKKLKNDASIYTYRKVTIAIFFILLVINYFVYPTSHY